MRCNAAAAGSSDRDRAAQNRAIAGRGEADRQARAGRGRDGEGRLPVHFVAQGIEGDTLGLGAAGVGAAYPADSVDVEPLDVRVFQRSRIAQIARVIKRIVDRKSTRLNSSHSSISYAVFCLKKKKQSSNRFC